MTFFIIVDLFLFVVTFFICCDFFCCCSSCGTSVFVYRRNREISWNIFIIIYRSSPPELFLGKDVLKICSKFTGEHLCRSVKSNVGMGGFLQICCIFLEHLFLRTPMEGCFHKFDTLFFHSGKHMLKVNKTQQQEHPYKWFCSHFFNNIFIQFLSMNYSSIQFALNRQNHQMLEIWKHIEIQDFSST